MNNAIRTLALWGLLLAVGAVSNGVAQAAGAQEGVFAEQAKELTAGKVERVDKLIALQTYVRDQIREVKTSYS